MTTKEFINKLEKLGYIVEKDDFEITIRIEKWCDEKEPIATVYYDTFGSVDTFWGSFEELSIAKRLELLDLCFKYITTPLADRAEERFYWKLKGSDTRLYQEKYLVDCSLGWELVYIPYAEPYTQKEYDKMVADGRIADIFEKEEIE